MRHVASEGGYLDIAPRRHAPNEWKGNLTMEGMVHLVLGETVEDVIHQLADRAGAI